MAFCLKNCCWVVAGQLKIDYSKCGEVDCEKKLGHVILVQDHFL